MLRRTRRMAAAAVLMVATMVLAACGGGGSGLSAGPGEPDPDGVFVRAVNLTDYGGLSFDPSTMATGQYQYTYPVTNSWLKMGPDGEMQPDLATEVEIVDPSTITVTMREGLKFSDGEVLDAQAAVASIKRTIAGQPSGLRMDHGLDLVKKMTVDSPNQFTITLSKPEAGLFYRLMADAETTPVSPKMGSEPGGHEQDIVTAGPFKIESYQPGVSVRMVKNENYWDADNVELAAIEYQHAGDGAAAKNALRGGTVDLASGNLVGHSDGEGLPANLTIDSAVVQAPLTLDLCTSDSLPLGNVKVRQALNFATDREAINKVVFGGDSEPAWGLLPSTATNYNADLKEHYAYDPEKAKSLLEEAGFPDGFATKGLSAGGNNERILEMVQAQWKKVGVDVSVGSTANVVEDWYLAEGRTAQVNATQVRAVPESFPRNFDTESFGNVCHSKRPKMDQCTIDLAALDPQSKEYVTRLHECEATLIKEEALQVLTVFPLYDIVYNSDKIGDMTYQMDPLTSLQPDVTEIYVKK